VTLFEAYSMIICLILYHYSMIILTRKKLWPINDYYDYLIGMPAAVQVTLFPPKAFVAHLGDGCQHCCCLK
jgi:hypothetical protein